MHRPLRSQSWSLVALLACATAAVAADSRPTIKDKTAGSERRAGLLNFYADADKGQLWLELPAPAGPEGEIGSYLYVEGLLTGLGSNPVGLDRGQIGETRLVRFRRVGGKVLLEQPNLNFRARTEDAAEARAGRESFATSVLWAADIAAQDKDGRILVDFAPFLLRDAHDAIGALKAAGQGVFTLDSARSAVDVPNCLAFPDNVEFESLLTFTSSDPGREVRATAPTPQAVTLVQHQSFVRLPPAGYQPRAYDPRTGSFAIGFRDTAAPLTVDPDVRFLVRHRLQKTDPAAARSTVREPIVYYIDPGAPEPVRTALLEGTKWWARAFEEAGFVDAFRVELLPADAHPLDVRYNVVQWVHRATRGWSYGGGVVDPRTGEMIKGHVTLGSLRVRQDRMIFEGLLGTEKTGTGAADDPVQLALWRIRQLAAHEVGHTLGLAHNFAASTYGRGSVMDYPAPLVGVTPDGRLDVSDVYTSAVGDWDLHAIRYAYVEFPPGTDEAAELEAMVRAALARGLVYLTDPDTRPAGGAQPLAAMWDNGADPVAALAETLKVRAIALSQFGERNVTAGTPLAVLEDVLGPLYFYHRYQLDAAHKLVGGMEFSYALRGDGQPPARVVAAERQRAALTGVLAALDAEVLDVPDRILDLLLPRPPEWAPSREAFNGGAAPAFDLAAAAAAASDLAISGLLQPQRAARLVQQHTRDPKNLSFEDVLKALEERVFAPAPAGRRTELARAAREVLVARLVEVAGNREAAPAVRARVEAQLERLRRRLSGAPERWHEAFLAAEIARHQARERTEGERPRAAPAPPPGPPIGSSAFSYQDCEFGG